MSSHVGDGAQGVALQMQLVLKTTWSQWVI